MISVICPVFNEVKNIHKLIKYFNSVLPFEKELILIDGGSTDGTKEIIEEWMIRNPNIFLIDNPKKYVPYALNFGIKNSKGNPIIRIDAHCDYSEDYFIKILETFANTDADIVGGPTRLKADSNLQKAVEKVLTSKLGVGGNKIHDQNYNGYTEHVTFGAWKRGLFDEIGFFDERLIRNQDDELHYRASSLGKKIFQNSEIKLWYHPRNSYIGLFRQYFQYGYYKPLVFYNVKKSIRVRHIIPSVFVVYLLLTPFAINEIIALVPLIFYFLCIILNCLSSKLNFKAKLNLILVFPLIHTSYGLGFIAGVLPLIKMRLFDLISFKSKKSYL